MNTLQPVWFNLIINNYVPKFILFIKIAKIGELQPVWFNLIINNYVPKFILFIKIAKIGEFGAS